MIEPLQHKRERVFFVREPVTPEGLAPLKILQRTDGPHIVIDTRRPLGNRTVATRDTYELAVAAAFVLRKEVPL